MIKESKVVISWGRRCWAGCRRRVALEPDDEEGK